MSHDGVVVGVWDGHKLDTGTISVFQLSDQFQYGILKYQLVLGAMIDDHWSLQVLWKVRIGLGKSKPYHLFISGLTL
jgi:hypothetical protein